MFWLIAYDGEISENTAIVKNDGTNAMSSRFQQFQQNSFSKSKFLYETLQTK